MNTKKVILFVVAIILLAIILWPRGTYKIARVEDGDTIVLDNGTTVHLIGVTDTKESKEFIEDNYVKVKVVLIPDSSSPFDPKGLKGTETVYAYVVQKVDAQCINSTLLRSGKTLLDPSYLSDSLKAYTRYAEMAR